MKLKTIVPHESKPDWFVLYDGDGVMRAAGNMEHCQKYATKTETFPDGSTITTDEVTGNRTVCGSMAHDEYFKRLKSERITPKTEYAIVAYCRNPDGSRKAELIRRKTENPIMQDEFGPYCWEVWTDDDPENVTPCISEARARQLFKAHCLFGTNGGHVS